MRLQYQKSGPGNKRLSTGEKQARLWRWNSAGEYQTRSAEVICANSKRNRSTALPARTAKNERRFSLRPHRPPGGWKKCGLPFGVSRHREFGAVEILSTGSGLFTFHGSSMSSDAD